MVIMTGAGVSMEAGLPSGPELVESALTCLLQELDLPRSIAASVSRAVPLEVLFQIVSDHAGEEAATAVTRYLDASTPTAAHKWIAAQQGSGLCRAIYTFNFDTLHEKSLSTPFVDRTVGRSVVLESSSGEWRLTKLHGSSMIRGVVSIGEYVQGFSDEIRTRLMEDWSGRTLLVLGYGGWDVDLRVTADEAITKRRLPRSIVWVDRSFPREGGRTDLIADFEAHGVACHRIESELAAWVGSDSGKVHNRNKFDYEWKELRQLDDATSGAIVAEACLISEQLEWAQKVAAKFAGDRGSRIEALLNDRNGKQEHATAAYRRIVESGWSSTITRALSAARVFTLTAGQIDLFDRVLPSEMPAEMARHFEAYVLSRRTDRGGLARDEAARRVRSLPRPFNTAAGVTSLDAVRLYINFLTESARILHEAGDYGGALILDKRALRFAGALGDPSLMASTSGGVGVCHMGLAEHANKKVAQLHLLEAERWLRKAIGAGRERIGDYIWGLHMCNLGSVLCELGHPRQGVDCLLAGLPVLTSVFPNWAVSCQAYLAMGFCDLFTVDGDPRHLRNGRNAVQVGWALANKLQDFDDTHLLKEAEAMLRAREGENGQ